MHILFAVIKKCLAISFNIYQGFWLISSAGCASLIKLNPQMVTYSPAYQWALNSVDVQKALTSEFMVRKILVGKLRLCLSNGKMDIFLKLYRR